MEEIIVTLKIQREQLLNDEIEKCLYIFSNEQWRILSEKLNELSITKSANRMFSRSFNAGAYETELDAKGRVCINKKLYEYANLNKDCVVLGVGNHIEIWDEQEYEKYLISFVRLSLRKLDYLLIDNIFNKITPEEGQAILLLIKDLFLSKNTTTIIVSDNYEDVQSICNRCINFESGSIV